MTFFVNVGEDLSKHIPNNGNYNQYIGPQVKNNMYLSNVTKMELTKVIDSHRSYLAGLNNGKHAIDKIYAKSVRMIQGMAISKKNSKMCYLVNNSFNDQRRLMQSNFNIINKAWRTGSSSSLSSVCSSIKSFNLFSGTAQKDK